MSRIPIVYPGQVYLHAPLNEYLVVTKSDQRQISYRGRMFRGHSHLNSFIKMFAPVDPADLMLNEREELLEIAPCDLYTGFVPDDDIDYEDLEGDDDV